MTDSPLLYRDQITQDDVAAIHVMVAGSGVFSAEEIDVAVELAEDALQHKEKSHYYFLLAERDGRLLGYSCFGRIPLTLGSYDLYWIVVDGNAQQEGVATGLLEETQLRLRSADCRLLYAETSSRTVYTPAQAFYTAKGFTLEARLKDFYAPDDDKLIFSKIL